MYYIDARGNYSSYIKGVTFSQEIQQNWASRNEENKRLSTSSSQDDYFEKQRLIQEAIAQLKQTGSVSSEIAKEVDVESLKESLENPQTGQASALSMLGQGGESQEAAKNSVLDSKNAIPNPLTLDEEMQNNQRLATLDKIAYEASKAKEKEEIKQEIEESLTSKNQESTMTTSTAMGVFLEKTLVQTSTTKPQNVSEEVKNAYNPLEVKEGENIAQNAVSFVDEVSGKTISVPLSEENVEKLVAKFGSLEEASDYVKGWYYDAAYNMGYLSGDSNGDGSISLEEGIHLKSLVSLKDSQYYSISERIPGGEEAQKNLQDSNLDGALNLNEMMGDNNELVLFKTGGESNNVDIFVIQKFSFEIGEVEETLNDILLNLGTKDEKQEIANSDSKDEEENQEKLVAKKEEMQEWLEMAKKLQDENYLNSLDSKERENLIKTEVILNNLFASA